MGEMDRLARDRHEPQGTEAQAQHAHNHTTAMCALCGLRPVVYLCDARAIVIQRHGPSVHSLTLELQPDNE